MENKHFRRFLLWAIGALCLSQVFFSCKISDSKLLRLAQERGICPQISIDSSSTNTKTTIESSDTSIHEKEKEGPAINLIFGDDCDSIKKAFKYLQDHPMIVEKNGIQTKATYNQKTKSIDISSIERAKDILLKNALRRETIYKDHFERLVKKEKCQLEHCNWWCNFTNWWFWITAVILAVAIYFKVRRWLPFRGG